MIPSVYRRTIDYMNDEYPFMVTHVLLMGQPVWSEEYPLARVVKIEGEDATEFLVNQDNMIELSNEECTFVLLKETMHVMLNHRKMQFENMEKAEIAAEVVINDYLVHYGLPRFEGILYGDIAIGRDSYGLTVSEVYDLLPEDPEDPKSQMGGNPLADMVKEQLEQKAEEPQDGQDGEGASGVTLVQAGAPEDLADAAEEPVQGGKTAGQGQTDLVEWAKKAGVELAWAALLKPLLPKLFNKHKVAKRKLSFRKVNRKTSYLAPEIIMPVHVPDKDPGNVEDGKKPVVVFAIDTSGSVSQETIDRFFRIAQTIPLDKVDVRFLSFTTQVVEFTLDRPRYASGGTNFSPIEHWIQDEYPDDYPSAVFVFTDGGASFYNLRTKGLRPSSKGKSKRPAATMPEMIHRWHWFIADADVNDYLPKDIRKASAMADNVERFVR